MDQARPKRGELWDSDRAVTPCRGLGCRVPGPQPSQLQKPHLPLGRKFDIVQCRDSAGVRRVSLGEHAGLAADEARKRAGAVTGSIKRSD